MKASKQRGVALAGSRAGFTMAEVLAVIAIIGVLMAVAVPNAIAFQRSLSTSELDAKAEQVYNAAQFQLASLKSAGRLGVLAAIDADEVEPADYPAAEGGDDIRFAVKGSAVMNDYLMPVDATRASSGILTGAYVIELSPASGEVYAVFYWEDGATGPEGSAFSGTTSAAIEAFYRSVCAYRPLNSGDFLADHGIGYFNGGGVAGVESSSSSGAGSSTSSSSSSAGTATSPEPVNGESLGVPIVGAFDSLTGGNTDLSKLKLSIYVEQVNPGGYLQPEHCAMIVLNGGASNAPTCPGGQYVVIDQTDLRATPEGLAYLLDSLEVDTEGAVMDISHQTGGLIERGCGVQVTVYAEYEDATGVYGPYSSVNSLFGSYDSSTQTVGVSNVRHLVNLANPGALSNQVTTVSITSDIVYDRADGAIEPIDVTSIIGTGNSHYIEGNGHVLEGFVIGDESNPVDNAGLFSYLRVSMRDLTVKDFTVYGKDNVGALVGNQINSGVAIENCHVEGGMVTGDSNVGGLVGAGVGASPYSNCSSTASVVATGSGSAGGFIGLASNCRFESCSSGMSYASDEPTQVTGRDCPNIGGFVGELESSCTMTGCQAFADVSGQDYVGGFVGRVDDWSWARVTNCQAACSSSISTGAPILHAVSGRSYVGGFAGNVVSFNALTGCRAMANVSGTGDYIGGFTGHLGSSGGENVSDCKVVGTTVDDTAYHPTYSGAGSHVGAFAGQSDYSSLKGCTSVAERA